MQALLNGSRAIPRTIMTCSLGLGRNGSRPFRSSTANPNLSSLSGSHRRASTFAIANNRPTCHKITTADAGGKRPSPRALTTRVSPPPTTSQLAPLATSSSPPPSMASSNSGFLAPPLNIPKWLKENAHLLQPPVNNYCVYNASMTVMIVGGPNARTDYHINETPEFFYQYKGRMLLKTVQNGEFRDVYIDEGELFLLPPNTPHNPVRFEDTVGIVIEQPRPEGSVDRLRWYCQACGSVVHEEGFHCTDLGTQIKEAVNGFRDDGEKRRCAGCGEICDVAPKKEVMEKMKNGGR